MPRRDAPGSGARVGRDADARARVTGDGAPGLRLALSRVGDRWTLLVVQALLDGPRRFNEIQSGLGGIAATVLTQRLRQLESDRLVVAEAYSTRPVRFSYRLTATGEALAGALRLLSSWGSAHAPAPGESAEPVVHGACGTPADARWWCPTCDRVVGDEEVDDVRWV